MRIASIASRTKDTRLNFWRHSDAPPYPSLVELINASNSLSKPPVALIGPELAKKAFAPA